MEYSDQYWLGSSQRAFDFDAGDGPSVFGDSKFSAIREKAFNYSGKDESNQFSAIRYDDLDEVFEKSSSTDAFPTRISPGTCESHVYKFKGNSNPLLIFSKKEGKTKGTGPEKTVRNMILGVEYSLTEFKSKKDKLDLLDAAVKTHDGNTILEVVLYLRSTFKKSIFQREIVAFPDALNVYLVYLEEDHETDELANILMLANKAEDAAFLKYEAAVTVEDPERKLYRIENCLSTHFQMVVTDSLIRVSIEEHCRILKEQIEFFKNNLGCSIGEAEMKQFEKLTGKKSMIDSSVICSLIYGCLFYYKSEKNSQNLACPSKLMTSYNLTRKQFTWAALRALASLKKWSDIDDLFMSKNWLGSVKLRSCISFSRIIEVLFKEKAPTEVLAQYVAGVENEQEKLELAQKYSCHSVAIEVLKNNKDRVGLIKYKAYLAPDSVDFYSIIEALNNTTIRWKN